MDADWPSYPVPCVGVRDISIFSDVMGEKMSHVVVIDENATEEELRSKSGHDKETKPKRGEPGWRGRWGEPHAADNFKPEPVLTKEEIKAFRLSQGWYQRHLAQRFGYHKKTIQGYESGEIPGSEPISNLIRAHIRIQELEADNARLMAIIAQRGEAGE